MVFLGGSECSCQRLESGRRLDLLTSTRHDEFAAQDYAIEAIEAIRDVVPAARFLQPEPVIHIVPAPEHPKTWRRVECDNLLQFESC